jgi:hypothetical protein
MAMTGWWIMVVALVAQAQSGVMLSEDESILLEEGVLIASEAALPAAPSLELRFTVTLPADGAGMGVMLCPDAPTAPDQWEEPSRAGCLGIGIDTHNPPGEDPFDAVGNIYGHPEREVSLHWDGREVANRRADPAFEVGQPLECAVRIEYVPGGAEFSVTIGESRVYEGEFVPAVLASAGWITAGASPTEQTPGVPVVEGFRWSIGDGVPPDGPAATVAVFEDVVLHQESQTTERILDLPELDDARIILTLTLERPAAGWDPWDRRASVYAWTDEGERVEILRWITPYSREWVWRADVTDYAHLLRGPTRLAAHCQAWGTEEKPEGFTGFQVSINLDYYAGQESPQPFAIKNLWVGSPEYGNPDSPLDEWFEPLTVEAPEGATSAKLRFWVTGHGMAHQNAAEFMPADRTVTVNGQVWTNTLWYSECYLNPCRPQGGTWKYERAGWAPGALVRPWDIDVTESLGPDGALRIEYDPMDYVNEARAERLADHWVEAQIIFYR